MPLGRIRDPFSHPDWFYEIKWDGFRALLIFQHVGAIAESDGVRLVSRNANQLESFPASVTHSLATYGNDGVCSGRRDCNPVGSVPSWPTALSGMHGDGRSRGI
jgi:hypothetical protein